MDTEAPGLSTLAADAREAARVMAGLDAAARAAALHALRRELAASRDAIETANRLDKEAAKAAGLGAPLARRLDVEGPKFEDMLSKVDDVISIADPVGAVQLATKLDSGLNLYRVACPIGVLCVIFESRPEAAVQIASLALKSANAVILKGGKEAVHTNAALVSAMRRALVGLEKAAPAGAASSPPPAAIQLVATRDEVGALLALHGQIDLVIPRGSNALVSNIMNSTRIPVMGHADGICSVYLHSAADASVAARVVVDSKTNYPVACNAAETLLLHEDTMRSSTWPAVATALVDAGVALRCDSASLSALEQSAGEVLRRAIAGGKIVPAKDEDFSTEFLALTMAVRSVGSVREAVVHINEHGSHHTDAIVSSDADAIRYFVSNVDAAGVYVNASTRFADGQRYGFGAEVGVSTNRIHSRGPMGVEGLLIYKYHLYGGGHCAGDYGKGKRAFAHTPVKKTLPYVGSGPAGLISARLGELLPDLTPRALIAIGAVAAAGFAVGALSARKG